jgi:nitrate/nitrite transport system substrate-binding protein
MTSNARGFFAFAESDQSRMWGKMMRKLLGLAAALALTTALTACGGGESGQTQPVAKTDVEKPVVKLGFIKLTDMAPLAIAKEKGFFAEEGLTVTLEPQANWKVLLDGVIGGQLDGAHMLAGQPIAASIGLGVKADLVAPLSLDLNGNAITLSNKVYAMIEPTLPKGPDGKPVHRSRQPR